MKVKPVPHARVAWWPSFCFDLDDQLTLSRPEAAVLHDMLEDKYIGLALAVSSSVAIGTSFIITKKVRSSTAERVSLRKVQLEIGPQ